MEEKVKTQHTCERFKDLAACRSSAVLAEYNANSNTTMEHPTPKRSRVGSGDILNHQECTLKHEALISLANDIFGVNSWSHVVTHQNIDYIDCESGKYSVGVAAFVKVELKNGVYHEDVGYGMCSGCDSKGYTISHARKEAVTHGLQEALCSFGGEVANRVNSLGRYTSDVMPFEDNTTVPQIDKHTLAEAASSTNRHLVGTSPNANMEISEDILKSERKRRQRQKQEEFLQQLKDKQATNATGTEKEDKENDVMTTVDMDDEALISTQEMDRMVQSVTGQQNRLPLLSSPTNASLQTSSLWTTTRDSNMLQNRVVPRQLDMSSKRVLSSQEWQMHRYNTDI